MLPRYTDLLRSLNSFGDQVCFLQGAEAPYTELYRRKYYYQSTQILMEILQKLVIFRVWSARDTPLARWKEGECSPAA